MAWPTVRTVEVVSRRQIRITCLGRRQDVLTDWMLAREKRILLRGEIEGNAVLGG